MTSEPAATPAVVKHFYWVTALEFSAVHGVDVLTLCGVWDSPSNGRMRVVEVVGGQMVLPELEDCPACLAALERSYWEADR